ncbi:hypothetical protein, partial [Paracoccus sp. M683]|uniref:hypothetical protein n=1 Tax=Paracoccus sp. M683 TaxID=2594268 RepID=UPI001C8F57E7
RLTTRPPAYLFRYTINVKKQWKQKQPNRAITFGAVKPSKFPDFSTSSPKQEPYLATHPMIVKR